MANLIGQVTIPASGKANLADGLPQPTGGKGITVGASPVGVTYVQQLIIQNNSGAPVRIGDVTVSVSRGILLTNAAPPNSANLGAFINYGTYLADWYVFGTAGDVVDFLYIQ